MVGCPHPHNFPNPHHFPHRNPHYPFPRLQVTGPIGEEGWAMLAEALRLLPPLKSWLHDLNDPLDTQRFRSFTVSSRRSSPKKFMLGGRRRDVKAVFDALPFGSFWYVKRFKEDGNWSKVWVKLGSSSWEKPERFMNTEEPRPALTSILIDQIVAWSNAICQWFYTSNI